MSDGAMTEGEAIRHKLESTVGPVHFSDVRAHLERDAVFVVAADLSLVTCGVAVAMDDVANVKAWIDAGSLRKPSAKERESWPTQADRTWTAVVVAPFVLIQDPLS